MRVKITRVEIVDTTTDFPDEEGFDFEAFKDSFNDTVHDEQDILEHETSDGKFGYITRELVELKIEEVK
jgi:hypothetical protein